VVLWPLQFNARLIERAVGNPGVGGARASKKTLKLPRHWTGEKEPGGRLSAPTLGSPKEGGQNEGHCFPTSEIENERKREEVERVGREKCTGDTREWPFLARTSICWEKSEGAHRSACYRYLVVPPTASKVNTARLKTMSCNIVWEGDEIAQGK